MKKKEREFYFEKDLKIDLSFKDKVFVYSQNGGYYISAEFGHMEKFNLISKISNNMAMNNRKYLIDQFEYDYKKDEDSIYQNELRQNYLKFLKQPEEKFNTKHKKVEEFLDDSIKKSDILIQRIDNDLYKYERERCKNLDENNDLNFDRKKNFRKNNLSANDEDY